ncbi:hypothetical protein PA598K_03774 [Paenibacillus sp. 598K]|nr:hypothetical protein PA598K_03774 [Paenibacillus sp. 598K]
MVFMLLCSITFASAATAEEAKPIKVYVDEEELTFDVPPLLYHYTTYVEFRSLFKALDYEISYDAAAKRIRARSADGEITIELTVGSSTAIINGESVSSPFQPLLREGRTLVPLRFVAKATGAHVEWYPETQTITVVMPVLNKSYVASIERLLQKLGDAESSGNIAEVSSFLHTNANEYMKEQMTGYLKKVNITTNYELIAISNWEKTSVMLRANKITNKISGGFYLDNNSEINMTLTRESDSAEWKIEDIYPLSIEYISGQGQLLEQPVVPDDDKVKIMALLEEEKNALNNRDTKQHLATLDPNFAGPIRKKTDSKEPFDNLDLQLELESKRIIYYDGAEAYVHVVQKIYLKSNDPSQGISREIVQPLFKLEDGSWRLRPFTYDLD